MCHLPKGAAMRNWMSVGKKHVPQRGPAIRLTASGMSERNLTSSGTLMLALCRFKKRRPLPSKYSNHPSVRDRGVRRLKSSRLDHSCLKRPHSRAE